MDSETWRLRTKHEPSCGTRIRPRYSEDGSICTHCCRYSGFNVVFIYEYLWFGFRFYPYILGVSKSWQQSCAWRFVSSQLGAWGCMETETYFRCDVDSGRHMSLPWTKIKTTHIYEVRSTRNRFSSQYGLKLPVLPPCQRAYMYLYGPQVTKLQFHGESIACKG